MSRSPATANSPARGAHCKSPPRPCGSMAPRKARLPAIVERFVLKTPEHAEEDKGLYSTEHGNKAHELHRSEEALFSARRDEKYPKLRRKIRVRHPRPTPPSSHQSPLHKDPAASSVTRKTQGRSLFTAGVSLPLADPSPLPNGTPISTPASLV